MDVVNNTHISLILQLLEKKKRVGIIVLSISSLTDALKESVSVVDQQS